MGTTVTRFKVLHSEGLKKTSVRVTRSVQCLSLYLLSAARAGGGSQLSAPRGAGDHTRSRGDSLRDSRLDRPRLCIDRVSAAARSPHHALRNSNITHWIITFHFLTDTTSTNRDSDPEEH